MYLCSICDLNNYADDDTLSSADRSKERLVCRLEQNGQRPIQENFKLCQLVKNKKMKDYVLTLKTLKFNVMIV